MLCIRSMHLDWRIAAGLSGALSLVVSHAGAQPAPPASAPAAVPPPAAAAPESLETPDLEPPPSAPPTPPAPPPASAPPSSAKISLKVPSEPDTRPLLPIRAQRRLALTGEIGWNGLAGFGPVLTYYPGPHFGLDLGLGFSLLGGKIGLRGRYNFLTSAWTPFLGLGFNATT